MTTLKDLHTEINFYITKHLQAFNVEETETLEFSQTLCNAIFSDFFFNNLITKFIKAVRVNSDISGKFTIKTYTAEHNHFGTNFSSNVRKICEELFPVAYNPGYTNSKSFMDTLITSTTFDFKLSIDEKDSDTSFRYVELLPKLLPSLFFFYVLHLNQQSRNTLYKFFLGKKPSVKFSPATANKSLPNWLKSNRKSILFYNKKQLDKGIVSDSNNLDFIGELDFLQYIDTLNQYSNYFYWHLFYCNLYHEAQKLNNSSNKWLNILLLSRKTDFIENCLPDILPYETLSSKITEYLLQNNYILTLHALEESPFTVRKVKNNNKKKGNSIEINSIDITIDFLKDIICHLEDLTSNANQYIKTAEDFKYIESLAESLTPEIGNKPSITVADLSNVFDKYKQLKSAKRNFDLAFDKIDNNSLSNFYRRL